MSPAHKRKTASSAPGGLLEAQVPGLHWWMLRLGRWGMLLGLSALLAGLWQARLIPSVGTDSLIYHLTLPARWMQQGYLSLQDLPFHDGIAQYSPALSESLCYLLMSLTGDEHLCWLVQPAFMLLMAWVFYRSARLLGARRPVALTLTGMILVFEPFDASVIIVNNDIVLTTGAAIFLYGLLATRLNRGWPLVIAAAGLGLMLATKYIGVIYSAIGIVLLLPFAYGYVRRRWRSSAIARLSAKARPSAEPPPSLCDGGEPADPTSTPGAVAAESSGHARVRRRMILEIVLAIAVLLAGSFFLLRNWVLYGNPLYPSIVKVGGIVVFKGLYDTSVFARYGLTGEGMYRMLIDDKAQFSMRLPYSAALWLAFLAAPALWILSGAQWRRVCRKRASYASPGPACGTAYAEGGPREQRLAQPTGAARPQPVRRRPDARILAACVAFPAVSVVLYFLFTPFWREHRLLYPVFYALWLSAAYVGSVPLRLGRCLCGMGVSPMRRRAVSALPATEESHGRNARGIHGQDGRATSEGHGQDGRATNEPAASWRSLLNPRKLRALVTAALLVSLLLFLYVFWFSKDWFFVVAIVAAAFAAFLPWRRRLFARRGRYVLAGAFVIVCLTGPWWYPAYRLERLRARPFVYVQAYDDRGLAWNGVDAMSAGRPLRVAYTGTPIIFPLFGYFLQNQVVYVPISPLDHPGPMKMDPSVLSPRLLEPSPGLQLARYRRREMDANYWLRGLTDAGVDLLLVCDDPDMGGAQQELGVIQANPQRFELLLAREEKLPKVYLYRVLKGAVASDPSVATSGR